MSTPLIVTLCVVVWCLVLIFAVALCQAAAEGDRMLESRRGPGAAADAAPESVAGGGTLPPPPARNPSPDRVGGVSPHPSGRTLRDVAGLAPDDT